MRFFHVVAVFAASIVLTAANPTPEEESIFSDISDLSDPSHLSFASDSLNSAATATDPSLPLENSNFFDDFDDDTSLFTQDLSIAGAYCSAPNNGPARKRDNANCNSSPPNNSPITIPHLPNNLDSLENSLDPSKIDLQRDEKGPYIQEPLSDAIKSLPADDSLRLQLRLDEGTCLEPPYIVSLCCNGPSVGPVGAVTGTVYREIRACFNRE